MEAKKNIETCYSPKLFNLFDKTEKLIVISDIFRATSSICAAFDNGAKEIVAISDKDECLEYKEKGYLIAGERQGKILDYADLGNSPNDFSKDVVKDKNLVLNTTNGTKTIKLAATDNNNVVIGAFVNLKALTQYIIKKDMAVLILCSGWKNHYSLEDSLFAGALANKIIINTTGKFYTECDATKAAMDIWEIAKNNPKKYIQKAAHNFRLKNLNLDNVIDYCMSTNITNVIPVLKNNTTLINQKDI